MTIEYEWLTVKEELEFVLNKNGNYLTIKDGVADEVLR